MDGNQEVSNDSSPETHQGTSMSNCGINNLNIIIPFCI